MKRIQHKFIEDTSGNVGVLFASSLVAILVATGAAVDMTRYTSTNQKMQDAVDAATLYASQLEVDDNFESNANSFLSDLLGESELVGLTSSFNKEGDNVTGTASADLGLIFPGFLNKNELDVQVKSVVSFHSSGKTETTAAPCIMALSTTATPGMTMNSGAIIESNDCEVHVHSTQNRAMTINSGTTLNVARTCIAGPTVTDNTQGVAEYETSCTPAADPYEGLIPVPASSSCDYNNKNFEDQNQVMYPGTYCGWSSFQASNQKVTFNPGLYIIRGSAWGSGGWNVNGGEWEGTGVTFYYEDASKIQFNSGVSASMSAPETGDYAGIFMTENVAAQPTASQPWNRGSFILNDNEGFDFEGAIYLPTRAVTFNSGATVRLRALAIVADTLMINSANLNVESPTGLIDETTTAESSIDQTPFISK